MTLGSPHLTAQTPEQAITVPGMAHWAGTGPEAQTCAACHYRGTWRLRGFLRQESLNEWSGEFYRFYGCLQFKHLTGEWGPVVPGCTAACKYFKLKTRGRKNGELGKPDGVAVAGPAPRTGGPDAGDDHADYPLAVTA